VTETATTPAASEAHQDPANGGGSGAAGEGTGSGTQTGADSFAAEREQLQARARSFQSAKDQAEARAAALEAELAALRDGNQNGEAAAPPLNPELIVSQLESRMAHREEMRATANALRGEFPEADWDRFSDPTKFESADALRAAVEASHNSIKSRVDAAFAAREQALIGEIKAKYGIDLTPAAPEGAGAPSGDPSIEQIAAMSFAEKAEFDREHPGVIARVLRSATQ
jgi:hypothetical protein